MGKMYGWTSVNVQDRDGPEELADIPEHLMEASGDKCPLKALFQVLVGAWPEVEPHHILPGDKALKEKEDREGKKEKVSRQCNKVLTVQGCMIKPEFL